MSENKLLNVVSDDDMYICMSSQIYRLLKFLDVVVNDDILILCLKVERRSLIIIKIIKCICRDVFVLLVGAFKIAPLLTKAHAQHMTLTRVKGEKKRRSYFSKSRQGDSR